MPPQGESIGMALEDIVVLSRVLERQNATRDVSHMFETYDGLRRERIEAAWQEADFRFETIKDKGWLVGIIMDYLTTFFLWWTRSNHQNSMAYDVRDLEIPN
jgi:2-polyprenyl-6-methoxyphenol hydroxylase-like FAD-dependent oxidoreductase